MSVPTLVPREYLQMVVEGALSELRAENPGSELYTEAMSTLYTPLGWKAIAGAGYVDDRTATLESVAVVSRLDPLAINALRIWSSHVLGSGWTIQYNSDSRTRYSTRLKAVLQSSANRNVLRYSAQRSAYHQLLTEGELYYIVFHGSDNAVPTIRLLDSSFNVLDPITDPNDSSTVLYVPIPQTRTTYTFDSQGYPMEEQDLATKVAYYRIWDASPASLSRVSPPNVQRSARIVRLAVNLNGIRGTSMVEPVLPWIQAYKTFLSDRMALSKAVAAFAWKLKAKLSQVDVNAMKTNFTSQMDAIEQNPVSGSTAGSTFVGNDVVDITSATTSSYSGDAAKDGRLVRQQIAAGFGVTEPDLTGDPSVGNLASLTSMSGTMVRSFRSDQFLISDFLADVLVCCLVGPNPTLLDLDQAFSWFHEHVEVQLPEVLEAETSDMADSIVNSAEHLPNDWITSNLLRLYGERHPEKIVAQMEQTEEPAPTPLPDPEEDPDVQEE